MAELYRYKGKFELTAGSGKFVYVQTDEYRRYGRKLIAEIGNLWDAPPHFFHLRKGGHVEAARLHIDSQWFCAADVSRFFGSCRRSRLVRALRKIGYSQAKALSISTDSMVRGSEGRHLPYGFSQSPILATLCLHFSALGQEIQRLIAEGISISVYVDDIILSHDNKDALHEAVECLAAAARQANFDFSTQKFSDVQPTISAFNLDIAFGSLEIQESQFREFELRMSSGVSDAVKAGTLRYAGFVNPVQKLALLNDAP